MNVKATLSPDDLARACADAMWAEDDASRGLGMEIAEIKSGQATLTMTVRPEMVSLRLCGTTLVCATATRNSFFASPSPARKAARLSAVSCGRKWRRFSIRRHS